MFELLGLRLRRLRARRGGGYPENAAPVRVIARLAEPIGAAVSHTIDLRFGASLGGRSGGIRGTDRGGPQQAYRGYLPSLQGFTGAAWMPMPVPPVVPSASGFRPGLNQALPGTNPVPSAVRELINQRLLNVSGGGLRGDV